MYLQSSYHVIARYLQIIELFFFHIWGGKEDKQAFL